MCKKILPLFVAMCLGFAVSLYSQQPETPDTTTAASNAPVFIQQADTMAKITDFTPTLSMPEFTPLPKNPYRAVGLSMFFNTGIWGFSKFITKEEFAQISCQSVKKNLQTAPVWDTDKFSTNLIAHPYHGSLYFNSARANGYNFYQSVPFALGGSLMWEYFMETEPPSRNDLIATTIGGAALGEMTFRFSDLIIDNRTTGFSRFGRELSAGLIAPSRLLNRLLTGEAWRVNSYKGNAVPARPLHITANAGMRYVADVQKERVPGISFGATMEYGDIHDYEIEKPYEWFYAKIQADLIGKGFLLKQVSLIGALYNREIRYSDRLKITSGVFQHFDYFDSKFEKKDNTVFTPYYISEAVALGGGILLSRKGKKVNWNGHFFLNGIILGASMSDYFIIDDKDYNLGSGFSAKLHFDLEVKKFKVEFWSEKYRIYTWKGADENLVLKDLKKEEFQFLNAQGDRSTARLYAIGTRCNYLFSKNVYLALELNEYIRITSYKKLPKVQYNAFENYLFIGVKF